MKNGAKVLLVLGATLMLCGCSAVSGDHTWVPDCTAVQVYGSGAVTETLVDTLDKSYYDSAELESMVRSSVSAYDSENGADAVSVTSFESQNGEIRLVLQYRSAEDLAGYNNEPFYNGSMLGAQMAGFAFDCGFRRVKNGTLQQDVISSEEAVGHKEYMVLICDSGYAVKVPGNIVYISDNADISGSRVAKPASQAMEAADETEASALQTSGNGSLIYVIYEY